jgi:hypothetical protein
LAFIDLTVLPTEGHGGKFRTDAGGSLAYLPSGAGPGLFVGSRRGVPYLSKTDYRLLAGGQCCLSHVTRPVGSWWSRPITAWPRTRATCIQDAFALGASTSMVVAAFARPSTNAPAFRQNDAVVRAILRKL